MPRSLIPDWQRQKAREMRRMPTAAEKRLWRGLREFNRSNIAHFRRQAPIGPYIADFVDLSRRLIVEADGGQHGDAKDQERHRWLEDQGFRVLRFWNNDILGNSSGVLQEILHAVEDAATPHPDPPHEGEGTGTRRQRRRLPSRQGGGETSSVQRSNQEL